ncbi:MAG TPA: hypothetical protein VGH40_17255 [Roseiarcus sp.]
MIGGQRGRFIGETTFADAGLAGDRHQTPAPGQRSIDARAQFRELAQPADKSASAVVDFLVAHLHQTQAEPTYLDKN